MEDSYRNWFQVRYQYDEASSFEDALDIQRKVDLQVLQWAMNFTDEELWHVRFGLEKGVSWFALRVKPAAGKIEERLKQARSLGEKIPATPIVDNKKWWTSDDTFPCNCKTNAEWLSMAQVLKHVSMIVFELVKMDVGRDEYFLYHVVIHHLHNMMHIQDQFYPIPVQGDNSQRALLMSGRLIVVNNSLTSWIPPRVT